MSCPGLQPSGIGMALTPAASTLPYQDNPIPQGSGSQSHRPWKSGSITIQTSVTLPISYLSDHHFKKSPPKSHPFDQGPNILKALHQFKNTD